MKTYKLKVAGLERDLPICPVNEHLDIAAFVIFGDVELTVACARELIKKMPPHDIMITAESKGIPLIYEMARQTGENQYILARKAPKLYMKDVFTVEVNSITTDHRQSLCIARRCAASGWLSSTTLFRPVNLCGRWSSLLKPPAVRLSPGWRFWPKGMPATGRTSSRWRLYRCS